VSDQHLLTADGVLQVVLQVLAWPPHGHIRYLLYVPDLRKKRYVSRNSDTAVQAYWTDPTRKEWTELQNPERQGRKKKSSPK
jgi:hypothetical protein